MQKSTQIIIRVTPAEKSKLEQLAREAGVTMSEYIRALLFDSNHLSRMVAKEVARQMCIKEEVLGAVHYRPGKP